MTRTLAIVPARGGSKRLPGKNLREFLGKPLINWTINFARSTDRFDEVLVSTDSADIARVSREAGVSVPWMRPPELASDTATTVDVVQHTLTSLAGKGARFDYVAVLQPTTPVRVAARWQRAFELLDGGAPAAIGVAPVDVHPYWTFRLEADDALMPFFPDGLVTRSQDLPPACVPTGGLYLVRVSELERQRTLMPPGVRAVMCDFAVESVDIDTQADWEEAERRVQAYLRSVP
jgi:CMP-N-acetylneuraminic acid synthetase